MPAKINIVSGVSSGSTIWIERPVMRIGSHPDVDVCIPTPELAEHVVTIEYRGGVYVIYNRAQNPISIDGVEVVSGDSAHWSHGGELSLGDDTVLELELIGDGSPVASPTEHTYDDEDYDYEDDKQDNVGDVDADAAAESIAPVESPLKMIGQVAVIVFCFLAIGVIGYQMVFVPEETTSSGTALEVNELLEELASAIKQADSSREGRQLESLLDQFKQAELSRIRGDDDNARRQFESLRAQLLRRQEFLGEARKDCESKLLDYVLIRLT